MTAPGNQPLKGIALKIVHVFLVTVMLALIKSIDGMPVTELVFFRSFFGLIPIVVFLALRGTLRTNVKTARPGAHLLRAILSLLTTALTFLAVRSLPLPEAITLQYTQPLFVVALSALLLGEPVKMFRWAAVAVGFGGALIITWPKLTMLSAGLAAFSNAEVLGAAAALMSAASFALNILVVGQLVRTESSATISLWLGFYSSALLILTLPFGWVWPTIDQILTLMLVGLLGSVLLIALSESLRAARPSVVAPFEYSSLIFASVIGFVFFAEIPSANTLIGGAVLIAAGLAILWREQQLKIAEKRAPGLPRGTP